MLLQEDEPGLGDETLREIFGDELVSSIDFTTALRTYDEHMAEVHNLYTHRCTEFLPATACDAIEAKMNMRSWWVRRDTDAHAIDGFVMDWFDGKGTFDRMKGTENQTFYYRWMVNHQTPKGGKLFRDFKEYRGWTRKQVYEDYCRIFSARPKNGRPSALELFLLLAPRILHANMGIYTDVNDLMRIISVRLWYATLGVVREDATATRLESMGAKKGWLYERATGADENDDIDGFITVRNDEGVWERKAISIKNMNALSIPFLWRDYRSKGKTKPDWYVGFPTKANDKLKWISAEKVEEYGRDRLHRADR